MAQSGNMEELRTAAADEGLVTPPPSMNGCPQPTDPARTIPLHMGHRWLLPLGSGLAGRTLILPHAHSVDYFSRIIWPCPQHYNQVNFLLESCLLTTNLGKHVIFNTDMLFKEIKVAWLYLLQHRPEEVERYINGTSAEEGVTEQLGKAYCSPAGCSECQWNPNQGTDLLKCKALLVYLWDLMQLLVSKDWMLHFLQTGYKRVL